MLRQVGQRQPARRAQQPEGDQSQRCQQRQDRDVAFGRQCQAISPSDGGTLRGIPDQAPSAGKAALKDASSAAAATAVAAFPIGRAGRLEASLVGPDRILGPGLGRATGLGVVAPPVGPAGAGFLLLREGRVERGLVEGFSPFTIGTATAITAPLAFMQACRAWIELVASADADTTPAPKSRAAAVLQF